MECLRLRVKDLDFDRRLIVIREGKGNKDRITMLPSALEPDLKRQLDYAKSLWKADRAAGRPGVETPPSVARKYPRAAESWAWFWVFPSDHEATDPRTQIRRRHNLYEGTLGSAIKRAARRAQIAKQITTHTLRHSFCNAPAGAWAGHPYHPGANLFVGCDRPASVHAPSGDDPAACRAHAQVADLPSVRARLAE
jgi:integrase